MDTLEIDRMNVMSMAAGGVILRLEGQRFDEHLAVHLDIDQVEVLCSWFNIYAIKNRELIENSGVSPAELAARAINRTRKPKAVDNDLV